MQSSKGRYRRKKKPNILCLVLGELYCGARQSTQSETNIKGIDEFASSKHILLCETETAHHYGMIKAQLRTKRKPIPENDLWIAAIAMQHQLTLITRDSHFQHVEELVTEY